MAAKPRLLMIAGFGDNASMFAPLSKTELADHFELIGLNLPGFGAPALEGKTDLETLADWVADQANPLGAQIILAHSVASIIASFAVQRDRGTLNTVLSLEGNLTAEDAYFSGTAADYPDANTFRADFLNRLDQMAAQDPILQRYRTQVMEADAHAMWTLGRDARLFSNRIDPGLVLMAAPRAHYFYNPENCPDTSLAWLKDHELPRSLLPGASHWASLDAPETLNTAIIQALQSDP